MISCRKIPLRIEPKTYFALERTYLSWMHMAVMLGGITSALVGFSAEEESDNPQGHKHKRVTQRTTQIVAMLLLPIAMLMVHPSVDDISESAYLVHRWRGLAAHHTDCCDAAAAHRHAHGAH